MVELCDKAGHIQHTYPEGRAEEPWLLWLPYILDRFVGFIDKIRYIGTILSFLLASIWSRGWRSNPTSVLPIGMSLGPITRATVVIFSKLGFVVSFTVCYLLIVFFSVTFGEETPIFVPLTLRRGVGRTDMFNISEWKPEFGGKWPQMKDDIWLGLYGPILSRDKPCRARLLIPRHKE